MRGKTEYDRTAFTQMVANGNIRFASPKKAQKAKQKAQERAKRNTNLLELS